MTKPVSPEDLLVKYRGEHAHAQHVAHLSAILFDAVKNEAHFTRSDRKILQAAALLHDVGYGVNPADHVTASVKIIKRAPLRGFSSVQRDYLAAVVFLHRKNYAPVLKTRELTRLHDQKRAMKLAALLCIADGLDHSHVQDCEIHRATLKNNTFNVQVRSGWYAGNIHWSYGKTGLWNAVFGADIHFIEMPHAASSMRFDGLLKRDGQTLEAFRTFLYAQYRTYIDNIEGACLGNDSSFLHDLRVALRRSRMLFTYFKPALRVIPETAPHRDFIADLIRRIGRARDFQVWMDFIHSAESSISGREQKQWLAFTESEFKKNKRLISSVKKLLTAPATARKNRALAYYLRTTLPDAVFHDNRNDRLVPFSAHRLEKLLKRLERLPLISGDTPPGQVHAVRKTIRKLRYFSEYAEPALPPPIRELTCRLKNVADALGSLHDMDVHIMHIHRLKKTPPPPALMRLITTRCRQYREEYDHAWKQLRDPSFQKTVQAALRRARKKPLSGKHKTPGEKNVQNR